MSPRYRYEDIEPTRYGHGDEVIEPYVPPAHDIEGVLQYPHVYRKIDRDFYDLWGYERPGSASEVPWVRNVSYPEREQHDNRSYHDRCKADNNVPIVPIVPIGLRRLRKWQEEWTSKPFIAKTAKVSGTPVIRDNAVLSDSARVFGESSVIENAWIYENGCVAHEALAGGNSRVFGKAIVFEWARIGGDAWICGDAVAEGHARIGGTAIILGGRWDGREGPVTEGIWLSPGVRAWSESPVLISLKQAYGEIL